LNFTSCSLASDGNFTNYIKEESFIMANKMTERHKNAQASKFTVVACLGVRLRSPETIITVIGYS
jgi:hypothetical protein